MKRRRMTKSGSRSLFTATARQTHPANLPRAPMRGGVRL